MVLASQVKPLSEQSLVQLSPKFPKYQPGSSNKKCGMMNYLGIFFDMILSCKLSKRENILEIVLTRASVRTINLDVFIGTFVFTDELTPFLRRYEKE